ncbi:MAG: hypothetical protein Q9228_004590 [Teloschistes exilis]
MLISLTVGKVDAGVAVLLTKDKRLIEFPSILLPPSISSGSIVDITVSRNFASETAAQKSFQTLQSSILSTYGQQTPGPPVLRCRNATQTSIVLEWDPIQLATAELRSLSLYRNGSKAGNIPKPMEMTSTKISGLAVDTDYEFQLMLRTSAGAYSSEKLVVRTHKMTDLSGITVAPGIMPPPLRESLGGAIDRIGAKISETVRIDTTHFVCMEGRGREWEKAVEMNIPVVRPEWVEGCEREGRIVGVRGYYLNADPKLRQVGQGVGLGSPQRQQSQQSQRTYTRIDGSEASGISSSQLPIRGTPESGSSPSANNLRASNQPPPPMSPSEVGSPAPPPPAKDTPREVTAAQVSPSRSMPSVPASPDEGSVSSLSTSTDRVDEQSQQRPDPNPNPDNNAPSKKPKDNASMPPSVNASTFNMPDPPTSRVTLEKLPSILQHDTKVKVAGVDIDGMLRGKLVSKKKFLSIAKDGFGFCSVIFGWDMHDQTYYKELKISNAENGYRDVIAVPDLSSFRRIPWEDNVPFFLISFLDPDTGGPLSVCPRSLLRTVCDKLEEQGLGAMAGAEYEFYQFRAPRDPNDPSSGRNSSSTAKFLQDNCVNSLPPLTEGMFGYSLTRPVHNQEYYYGIYDACEKFNCGIEGWHTESGPGVFEAALEFGEIKQMADKAGLFKYVVKSLSSKFGITPCFMAKPRQGLPGNSGHMHVSIVDKSGKNLFYRGSEDSNPKYKDLAFLSDMGRHFLAGLLDGLPDIMPIVAPTVNSYKRLVENFWAPVTVSWGLEHRAASIRLIAPPTASPKATRFEVRVGGADANPFLVLAAILALGWRGVQKKMEIGVPPLGKGEDVGGESDKGIRLAKSLKESNARMTRKDSVAREVFGDDFVDHFGGTRDHEIRLWDEAVTDWEVRRYMETEIPRKSLEFELILLIYRINISACLSVPLLSTVDWAQSMVRIAILPKASRHGCAIERVHLKPGKSGRKGTKISNVPRPGIGCCHCSLTFPHDPQVFPEAGMDAPQEGQFECISSASTMAQQGHSAACCTVPPAVVGEYKTKGDYIDLDGMKVYVTGPSAATSAILVIYDIFGYSSQALQGADILAYANQSKQYRVFMPDFFYGKPLPQSVFPPDTDEKKKAFGDFFGGPAAPPANAAKVPELVKKLGDKYSGVKKWGSVGMCWGGKIVSLTSQSGTPWTVAAEVHPAMVDPNDAKGIKVPIVILASKDENAEDVENFRKNLSVENRVETFWDQVHGWMAARGDLKDEKVKKEYERGYGILLDFFGKHL